MRAPVLHGYRDMTYDEVPDPHPGPGQAHIRIHLCGICGSDVHRYDNPDQQDDQIMGHEFVGTVIELGEGAQGPAIGSRVIEAMNDACGGCAFCNRGEAYLCHQHYILESQQGIDVHGRGRVVTGGYGEYVALEASRLMAVPEDMTDHAAASVEAAAVGYHAVKHSGISLGDTAVVFGGGPIGLYTMQCAREAGATRVITVEPVAARQRAARELGVDEVVDPSQSDDVVAELKDLTQGGPDIVFEAAGVPVTTQQAIETVRPNGRVGLVGVTLKPATIHQATWVRKNLQVRTSLAFSREDFPSIIQLFRKQRVRAEPLITSVVPASETTAAFDRLLEPNEEIKILVEPAHD